jgi:hypothetical protein
MPQLLEHPIDNTQLIDPVVSNLVIGQPQTRFWPGDMLAPPVVVPTIVFQYTEYGVERLMDYEIERAYRANMKTVDFEVETHTDRLRRYTVAVKRDQDELLNADPSLSMRERCAALSREIVQTEMERKVHTMVATAGSFSTVTAVTNQWDGASGDSRTERVATAAPTSVPLAR